MDRYAYYVCFKCGKAYFGGEARCDLEAGAADTYNPEELVCGGCSDVSQAQMCPKHGTDYLEYKCRYCCSVAVFFCFGTTHFCNACHDDFQRVANIPKPELPQCPVAPKVRPVPVQSLDLHPLPAGHTAGPGRVSAARQAPRHRGGVRSRLWSLQERPHLLEHSKLNYCDLNFHLNFCKYRIVVFIIIILHSLNCFICLLYALFH